MTIAEALELLEQAPTYGWSEEMIDALDFARTVLSIQAGAMEWVPHT